MPKAPTPASEATLSVEHGHDRVVAYPWLSDQERGPRLVEHTKAENVYTDESFALFGINEITLDIKKEMLSRLTSYDTATIVDGKWSYYKKNDKDASAPSHWRFPTNSSKADSQLLFDEAEEARAVGGQLKLGSLDISDDGELLLVSFDTSGEEEYQFQVRRISDGTILVEETNIGADSYEQIGPIFNSLGDGVFFIRHDENQRNASISYREFDRTNGGWVTDEVVIYNEENEEFWVSAAISRDRKWVLISTGSSNTSEILVLERGNPLGGFASFSGRNTGLLFGLDILDNHAYLVADLVSVDGDAVVGGGEQNLYTVEFNFSSKKDGVLAPVNNWVKSLILPPHVILEDITLFDSYSAFDTRVNGLQRVFVASRDENGMHYSISTVGNPPVMSAQILGENPDVKASEFLIVEQGMQPTNTFSITFDSTKKSNTAKLIHSKEIPGLNADDYLGQLVYAEANDGTQIPFALVTPNNIPVIGSIVFVYGAYGLSDEIEYNSAFQSLLNRGIACITAYSRGGGELGQAWYHDGSLEKKATTMTDTLAVARKLREMGLAGIDGNNIVLQGGSAGGAAVGGTVNLDPESFAGVIGRVPFVDCLATMLDPNMPLTIGEYAEWGNPTEFEDAYLNIKSWAPVENIKAGVTYPPILATAGLNDPRVGIWEPARWVLVLRDAGNQAYLRTVSAGHAGSSDKFATIDENAERAAFAYWCLANKN